MDLITILHGTLRMATPIALAALGGLFTHRAGVLNIALEGMMLIGAFVGVLASYATGSLFIAVIAAIGAAMCFALLFNIFGISLKGNFIITGLAVNLFATGLAAFILQSVFGRRGVLADERIVGFSPLHSDLLERIPLIGPVLNDQTPMVYISILMLIIVVFVMYNTKYGIYVRAVGESEEAAEAIGIHVLRIKHSAVYVSAFLSSLAGVNLALENLSMFVEGMTGGRGFIALAAIFCGRGTPVGAFLFSFLFGFADSIQMRLQRFEIPGAYIQMIPYLFIVAILTVIGVINRKRKIEKGLQDE